MTPNLYNGNISHMVTTITNPTTGDVLPQATTYNYDQLNRLVKSIAVGNSITNNSWNAPTLNNSYENNYTYDANGGILTAMARNQAGTIIDQQTYQHESIGGKRINNRIYAINDAASATSGNDLLNQIPFNTANVNGANNYTYTPIGERKSNVQEQIAEMKWGINGKLLSVTRTPNSTKLNVKLDYDANAKRIAEHEYSSAGVWSKSTYYVRDAQGNIMSTYEHTNVGTASFAQTERHLYGSSSLGIDVARVELISPVPYTGNYTTTLGNKRYSLTNHLGNVLATITDKKIPVGTGNTVSYYKADIISSADYAPFGAYLTERTFNAGAYPNGFNGKRNDNALGLQDYGMRLYNPMERVFPTSDPLSKNFAWNSNYAFAENDVIRSIDLDGKEKFISTDGALIGYTGRSTQVRVVDDKNIKAVGFWIKTANNPPKNSDDQFAARSTERAKSLSTLNKWESYKRWEESGGLEGSYDGANTGGDLSGREGLHKTLDGVGEAGTQLQNISPLTGGFAPIVATTGAVLQTASLGGQTLLDINEKGAKQGLVNGTIRAFGFGVGKLLGNMAEKLPKETEALSNGLQIPLNKGIDIVVDKVIEKSENQNKK